jgi:hypothetical protein
MKKKLATLLIGILASAFFLAGFHGKSSSTLTSIGAKEYPSLYQKDDGVDVYYKIYDEKESKAVLGKNLLKKGYQTVQVTVENNSMKTYAIAMKGISSATATPSQVAWKYSADSIPRSIAYKVLSFFFPPMLIPGTVDTVLTIASHVNFKEELTVKSIKEDEEMILPYSILNRIFFVPKDEFQEPFTVTLVNTASGENQSFASS